MHCFILLKCLNSDKDNFHDFKKREKIIFRQASTFDPNKIRKPILQTVEAIAQNNQLDSSCVGIGCAKTKQYKRFESLLEKGNLQEFDELINHPNAVIKAYALQAILNKQKPDKIPYFKILKENLFDESSFLSCPGGCICFDRMLGDVFYDHLSSKLAKDELTQINNLLVYTDNNLSSKQNVLLEQEINPNYYRDVKYNTLNSSEDFYIIALARFQKEDDIDLIQNYKCEDEGKICIFQAITEFPHPKFLSFLEKEIKLLNNENATDSKWRLFYEALLKYPADTKTISILNYPIKHLIGINQNSSDKYSSERHLVELSYIVFKKEVIPSYSEIYFKLWENTDAQPSPEIIKFLCKLEKEKCLNLIEIKFKNIGLNFSQDSTFEMLDMLLLYRRVTAIKLIIEKLTGCYWSFCELLAKKIIEIKDPEFVKPMLKELESNCNYSYIDALLSYPIENIKIEIKKACLKDKDVDKIWLNDKLKKQ